MVVDDDRSPGRGRRRARCRSDPRTWPRITDFFGIGDEIWKEDDPAAALGALRRAMPGRLAPAAHRIFHALSPAPCGRQNQPRARGVIDHLSPRLAVLRPASPTDAGQTPYRPTSRKTADRHPSGPDRFTVTGCICSVSRRLGSKNAANSVGLNGSTRWPSVDVPSGKNSSLWPAANLSRKTVIWPRASRGRAG